ncbi:CDGSH-type Zn-finger protein [Dysgonomonas sp. PH5-45]|uniref:CDGSH iron-sulfur domain-containing protein n=1 Tax=unclassified Dysgonomonas TaxID=2630389 RepID=UPI00247553BD|nr:MULTISPECIES: CDGSH iron-sulfur domain-containing protein [unclassified Dysgonomonas]MDH6355789.1 CDGSH-type Zn-finger protein [Dysgonomonas sp. PH5-45]MDH6388686.1 CDGSH-type Zn-finger protein [Dysgonomonas sp. PH5-37]
MQKESLLKVKVIPNGPIAIEGKVEIMLPDGNTVEKEKPFLCRCGASNKKPYCDGTHVKIGFKG